MQAPMMPASSPPSPVIPPVRSQRPSMAPPRTTYIPTTMLPGFFVNSESDINANDIATDGSISIFPYRDLSRIVIKQWVGPSTLESAVYVLQQPPQQNTQAALPPPPPPAAQVAPVDQPQAENQVTNDLVSAIGQLTNNILSGFGQMDSTLRAMGENLEKLNSKFINDEGRG